MVIVICIVYGISQLNKPTNITYQDLPGLTRTYHLARKVMDPKWHPQWTSGTCAAMALLAVSSMVEMFEVWFTCQRATSWASPMETWWWWFQVWGPVKTDKIPYFGRWTSTHPSYLSVNRTAPDFWSISISFCFPSPWEDCYTFGTRGGSHSHFLWVELVSGWIKL